MWSNIVTCMNSELKFWLLLHNKRWALICRVPLLCTSFWFTENRVVVVLENQSRWYICWSKTQNPTNLSPTPSVFFFLDSECLDPHTQILVFFYMIWRLKSRLWCIWPVFVSCFLMLKNIFFLVINWLIQPTHKTPQISFPFCWQWIPPPPHTQTSFVLHDWSNFVECDALPMFVTWRSSRTLQTDPPNLLLTFLSFHDLTLYMFWSTY